MKSHGRLQQPLDLTGRCVWVAGHRGMVGQALVRRLQNASCELLTADRKTVDLLRQQETEEWMAASRPEIIFLAAATVGGIWANDTRPAEFIYNNLAIQTNVVNAVHALNKSAAPRACVEKVLILGSSCIYPRHAEQPIREDALLTGPLEPTNQWYAVAKIAGIKLAQAFRRQYGYDFISAMPTNLYGPGDNFDLQSSHVVPALMRKIHEAKDSGANQVTIWGTGTPRREFLHVDDCAAALVHLMRHYSAEEHVNVGTGTDITIRELAETIARVVGYEGEFVYDRSKPDGMPRKLLDVSKLTALGWQAEIELEQGLRRTYEHQFQNSVSAEVSGSERSDGPEVAA